MAIEFVRCKACGKPQRSDRKVCVSCGADVLTGVRLTTGKPDMGSEAAGENSGSFTGSLFHGSSYIEQNLMPGEKVIYRTGLHPVVLFGPGILAVAVSVAVVAVTLLGIGALPLIIILLLFFVVVGWAISSPSFLGYFTSEFGITSERVLVKVGFFRRRSLEILLTKVEGVVLDQSILGRIFDYGTVIVIGTGGTKEPLDWIDAPLEFRKRLQEQIAVIQGPKKEAGRS